MTNSDSREEMTLASFVPSDGTAPGLCKTIALGDSEHSTLSFCSVATDAVLFKRPARQLRSIRVGTMLRALQQG
jgi:hypothetical protein